MTNSSSVEERLKMKRMALDVWTVSEKLRLASFVEKNGNQNWASVSRSMKAYFQEQDEWSWTKPRPPDWYSQKNCAQQFSLLLDSVETPKRKKRSGGSEETQVQTIKRTLLKFRNDEIDKSLVTIQEEYLKILEQLTDIVDGDTNVLNAVLAEIERDKVEQAQEEEEYQRSLKEREERRIELQRAIRAAGPISIPPPAIRRGSSLSDLNSDVDSPGSEPLAVEVPEETVVKPAPVPTPTSPLLSMLLTPPGGGLPPTPATPPGSILHSAITSPLRGVPAMAARINTSPISANVSPSIKNLVAGALGAIEDPKPPPTAQSPSQGAPTLSMLLELPPSLPGKPLPVLPAPPPYSGHLGPPPPYPQAKKYLEEQRAEQAAQQAMKNELILTTVLTAEANAVLPKTSPKNDIDLADIEEVIAGDVSRSHFNTTDHDYGEPKREEFPAPPQPVTPVWTPAPVVVETVETKPEKNELDVFDFEEDDNQPEITYKKTIKEERVVVEPAVEVVIDEPEPVIVTDEPVEEQVITEEEKPVEEEVQEIIEEVVEKDDSPVIVEEVKNEDVEILKEGVVVCDDETEDVSDVAPPPAPAVDESPEVAEPETVSEVSPEVSVVQDEKEDTATTELKVVGGVKRRRGTLVADSVPNSPVAISEEEKDFRAWKKSVQMVHSRIEGHKSASLFLRPINDDQAPDYSQIIHKPVDLSTIKRNLENGAIRTSEEYLCDVLHMFLNARMYNKTQSVVYKQAVEMQEDCLEHILVMMDLRGESPTWWKRPRTHCEKTKTRPSRTSVQPNTRASLKSAKRAVGSDAPPAKKIKIEDVS